MKCIKPKNDNAENVDWLVSERIRNLAKTYADYTEYTESKIVNKFLLNLLDDNEFIGWFSFYFQLLIR